MGVPSDHAYGDKHGSSFLIKKKCKEKNFFFFLIVAIATAIVAVAIVSSASWFTKSRRGQRIECRKRNSEAGCSIASFASDSSQQSSPDSFECWLLINIGYIRGGGRKFLGHFDAILFHNIRRIIQSGSYDEGTKMQKKRVLFVSFSVHMLLSDIWSRSSFWVFVHASWVLMSPKELPVYRRNESPLLKILVLFARYDMSEWCWRYLWHKMAFKISQEFPTVSLEVLP